MDPNLFLQDEKGLVGKSLDAALAKFKELQASKAPIPVPMARFKKKEPLETMVKSIIKHRIQALTGQSITDIENALGFNIKKGQVMSVDQLRHLAHLLILEANGVEDKGGNAPVPSNPTTAQPSPSKPRKRNFEPEAKEETTLSKRSRTSRRSMAAAAAFKQETELNDSSLLPASKAKRVSRKSLAPEAIRSNRSLAILEAPKEEVTQEDDADEEITFNSTLTNPTPEMIRQEKKKMANTKQKVVKLAPKEETPMKLRYFPGGSYIDRAGKTLQSYIYLLNAKPLDLRWSVIHQRIPEFTGCNLCIIHTPIDWDGSKIFNLVKNIREINKNANLSNFLVLVGCGIQNVNELYIGLASVTEHVQLVATEIENLNMDQLGNGKLRSTTAFFLLAYIFPNCNVPGSVLPEKMVMEGATTCFKGKNIEDLEHALVTTLSEAGDWILDLCCRSRGIALAAQKSGRFAISVEEDRSHLEVLKTKATLTAKLFATDFNEGEILD